MELSESDILFFQHAVRLAREAEREQNLPIGAVVTLEGRIIAEGKNAIRHPALSLHRHAETEALRTVPGHLWKHARSMTLYSTLEPCLMCLGAVLLHQVGRVLFGSADPHGGAGRVIGHMPPYFEEQAARMEWIGPAYPSECDELYERVGLIEGKRSQ